MMEHGLRLENRHTGEVLHLCRVRRGNEVVLELEGEVPPKGDGPPLHIHLIQREEGRVTAGVMSGVVGRRTVSIQAGEPAVFEAGVPHRWWNAEDQPLRFEGRAVPAADLDRYLQATFAAVNAGPPGRMPLFYIAHIMYRHRRTQRIATIPLALQYAVFPAIVAVGWLLGKYRGDSWPGAPAACPGAPEVEPARG